MEGGSRSISSSSDEQSEATDICSASSSRNQIRVSEVGLGIYLGNTTKKRY